MSDTDPTPETPVTIGDRLGWFRGDLAARLDQLRGTPAADLAQVLTEIIDTQATILALRGSPERTLSDIDTQISNLRGVNNATLSSLLTESQFDTTMQYLIGYILDIRQYLDELKSAIGAAPYQSLEIASVRGLLNALLSAQGSIGILPDELEDAIGSSITRTLNGRRYVVWNSPIEGLTRSNDNIELTADDSWEGYQIYVQSDADTCWISADFAEWPTNSWLTQPLQGTISVSVTSNHNVRAYIRVPAAPELTMVYTWFANEWTLINTSAGTRYRPSQTKYPELVFQDTTNNLGPVLYSATGWQNWTFDQSGSSGFQAYHATALNGPYNNLVSPITHTSPYLIFQYQFSPGTLNLRRPQPS